MGLSNHIPSSQVWRLWPFWWRRLRVSMECTQTSYCSATHFWGECSLVQEWFNIGYSHSSYYNCHDCTVDSPLITIYIFPTYWPLFQFHQQLFVLDTQVRHLNDKNLVLFGSWLSRRWNNCAKKKSNAMQALHELSVDETPVCQQWKLQVEHQTRPLPRKCHVGDLIILFICVILTGRSKTSNDEEISKILSIEKSLAELDGSLRCMEMQLCTGNIDNLVDFNLCLIKEHAHWSRLADTLSCWKARLGINQCTHLDQLGHNVYLQVHLDAQALKTHIREQLRHEID